MEKEPFESKKSRQIPQGRSRIKKISQNPETGRFDPDLVSILPETSWEDRMTWARTTAAREKAAALKGERQGAENGRQVSGRRTWTPEKEPQSLKRSGRERTEGTRPVSGNSDGRRRQGGLPATQRRPSGPRSHRKGRSFRLAKIIAALLIFVVIVGCVAVIITYSQGSSTNRRGLRAYNDGEYTQAAELFGQALESDPSNSEYLVNLGMTYIALGQYDEALSSFDTAITNTNQSSILQLAKRGSGIVYLSSGHYSKAADLFREALSYSGASYGETEIDILYYLAEALEQAGDSTGAVDCYTQIIEYQEDANAYMLRGLAYQSAGDNASAESDLEKAIDSDKRNYKTYLALYEVLTAQGKTDEAAQVLNDALLLGGKNGEDYSNRGIVYMYQGDYEGAQEAFNTALEKGYNGAYLGLAQSLSSQGDYEGAAAMYEQYLAIDTSNAAAYNEYGLCLMELERYEDAQAAFAAGIEKNDRLVDRELMYNEAVALEYLKDWEGALEKMRAFVEKYPDDAQGQHELTFLESMLSD
ncbi:tetratricopeptide (TPR) repeat protein [Catenibacillus scindens]|uniref:Tetratricopeptide (TPR) repeat protein n=1 Tax=Catenibacillus scindens TaxID=673271 RepID=A0A7W8H9E6_9FIRM|nr:tetratricopeptide (TPR) repeat protein [Catenibacillus scindens]